MTYHNAIKYINSAPLRYENDNSVERISTLCAYLGEPQKNLKYIRLAGCSGKTVCAAMLTEIFSKSHIQVGTLTMPASDEPFDSVRICGTRPDMSETVSLVKRICLAVGALKADIEYMRGACETGGEKKDIRISESFLSGEIPCEPTKNEILLAAALLHFRDNGCRLCIIESDHTPCDPSAFLPAPFAAVISGTIPNDDINEILRIKSYIVRGISEIVSAPQNKEAYKIISDACAAVNCRLSVPAKASLEVVKLTLKGSGFIYRGREYRLNMCGRFQITNATTVIETVGMLNRMKFGIGYEAVAYGIEAVRLKSKFEVLSVMPTVIADSTHNNDAVRTVCDSMNDFKELTGTHIRLCFPPTETLIDEYINCLGKLGYDIGKIYIADLSGKRENSERLCEKYGAVLFTSAKETVKKVIPALDTGEILLVSGTSGFTDVMRFEILRFMEF